MIRLSLLVLAVFIGGVAESSAQNRPRVVDETEFPEATAQLIHIDQLIADPTGGGWLLDSRVSSVLRLEETGQTATLGREGAGPGEFRDPWRLSLVEDTLWVVDIGLDRIIGIDPWTGEPLGNIRGSDFWRRLPAARTQSVAPLGVTNGGVLVAIDEPETSSVLLVVMDRGSPGDRRYLDPLDHTDADLLISVPGHSRPIQITNPFSNSDLLALGNHGRYVGRVRQSPEFQAEVVDLREDSEPVLMPWPSPRRQVTDAERSAWVAQQTQLVESFLRRRFFASEGAAMKAISDALQPGTVPVVRRLTRGIFERSVFIDTKGDVWFERWSLGESDRAWYRVSPTGGEQVITLRSDEELLDVNGRFLWKQRLDSFGVPHLFRVEFAPPVISPR